MVCVNCHNLAQNVVRHRANCHYAQRHYSECYHTKCHYAECRHTVSLLSAIMLRLTMRCHNAEFYNAYYCYADCYHVKCVISRCLCLTFSCKVSLCWAEILTEGEGSV